MSFFAVNLLLAFIWSALRGISLQSLLLGFVIGFLALMLSQPFIGSRSYVRSSAAIVRLTALFFLQLIGANVRLARDVLRRQPRFAPAFLAIDVADLHPGQAAVLAGMVSLTPGSITVDVQDDGRTLVVHTVYARDPDQARRAVRALADIIAQIGHPPEPDGGERS